MALPALPAILSGIGTVLVASIVPMFIKLFTALGFGVVTYTGISAIKIMLINLVIKQLDGLPLEILGLIGYSKVDIFITLCLSGYITGWIYKGTTKVRPIRRDALGTPLS